MPCLSFRAGEVHPCQDIPEAKKIKCYGDERKCRLRTNEEEKEMSEEEITVPRIPCHDDPDLNVSVAEAEQGELTAATLKAVNEFADRMFGEMQTHAEEKGDWRIEILQKMREAAHTQLLYYDRAMANLEFEEAMRHLVHSSNYCMIARWIIIERVGKG